jgi:hypothetical protein
MALHRTIYDSTRFHRTVLWLTVFSIAALAATEMAAAAVITFETDPAGVTPVDDAPLTAPYTFPGLSISFGFDTDLNGVVDANAKFEEVGLQAGETPLTGGFLGSSGPDTPDPPYASQLGHWFLRGPVGANDFGLMVINYSGSTVVTAASGEIWDIDGNPPSGVNPGETEEYKVRAYDSLGNLLDIQTSPLGVLDTFDPASLDGQPWTFSFSGLSAGISTITIDFTGTKTLGIGLAFNNFNPTQAAVPEPSGWMMLTAGCVVTGFRKRRGRVSRE